MSSSLPYWVCQAHIRHANSDKSSNSQENNPESESVSETTKVKEARTDEEVANLRLAKLLARKRRKKERQERRIAYKRIKNGEQPPPVNRNGQPTGKKIYLLCGVCKNPRCDSCEFELCKRCCKQKMSNDDVTCKSKQNLLMHIELFNYIMDFFIFEEHGFVKKTKEDQETQSVDNESQLIIQ